VNIYSTENSEPTFEEVYAAVGSNDGGLWQCVHIKTSFIVSPSLNPQYKTKCLPVHTILKFSKAI
jgi:hypothetical protein